MFGWRLHSKRGLEATAEEQRLAQQCEAFLQGRLADERAEHGELPQPWEWINLLAHADRARLATLAHRPPRRTASATEEAWWTAVSYLAAAILEAAEEGPSLHGLQTRVLVPLELEMAADSSTVFERPEASVRTVLFRLQRAVRPRPD